METSRGAKVTENDARASEVERRKIAQEGGPVVSGSGERIKGRSMEQMVSVRLEAELVGQMREIATRSGTTLSEVIRTAVSEYIASTQQRHGSVEWVVEWDNAPNLVRHAVVASVRANEVTRSALTLAGPRLEVTGTDRDLYGKPSEAADRDADRAISC